MAGTLKDRIRQIILSEHGDLLSGGAGSDQELKEVVRRAMEGILKTPRRNLGNDDKQKIISEVVDELTGLGPIEKLMQDPAVTEIMINGPGKIYAERNGKKELQDISFESEEHLMAIVHKMLEDTRRRVDESYPYTDLSLKDGSRVNIIIPPLALDGTIVTIRKFLKSINSVDDFIRLGTIDKRMADFLVACVRAKVNMIFSGATGSGKTTTLNVLSSYIGNKERIVTIEDTAELRLAQEHVVRLQAKTPNIEGKGEVDIGDLFRNCLRMRPNRIILGEVRGKEALDMLQAMCSGHRGALAVIHASSPDDVLRRLETMVLASGIAINLEALHRQIAAAINLIIQHEQFPDGSRKITHLTQVDGLNNGQAKLDNIFLYDIADGRWKASGVIPVFYPLFKKAGIDLAKEIFNKD